LRNIIGKTKLKVDKAVHFGLIAENTFGSSALSELVDEEIVSQCY